MLWCRMPCVADGEAPDIVSLEFWIEKMGDERWEMGDGTGATS